jgi:acyl carrier protein
MEHTCQRVCRVIGALAGIDPDDIGPGQCLGYVATPNHYADPPAKPLELDSLDRVQLAMHLEDEFSIQITDDEADQPALDHVGGLVAFVQGKLDARGDRFQPFGVGIPGAQPMVYGDLIAVGGPLHDRVGEALAAMGFGASVFGVDIGKNSIGAFAAGAFDDDGALRITATGTIPAYTEPMHTSAEGELLLTDDMRLTNSGVLSGEPVVTGLGELGPIRLDPDAKTPWQKAHDALAALGLNPADMLIPEWQWYAARDGARA